MRYIRLSISDHEYYQTCHSLSLLTADLVRERMRYRVDTWASKDDGVDITASKQIEFL